MQPRIYQQECLDAIQTAQQVNQQNKTLVVMATGLGKTVVSAFAVHRLMQEEPGRVLYLCHQNDILRQARAEYQEVLDGSYTYGYFHGVEKHLHKVDVLFASFQTMAKNRELFNKREFKYIIVDEVHHVQAATFRPTIEYFDPQLMIGLTATPHRHDGLDITELFGQPVYNLGVAEALARGYLCKVDYRLMTDEIQNLEMLDTPVGKLNIAKLNRTIFIPKRDEEIVRIIEEKAAKIMPHRVMIFCPSIQYATRLSRMMPKATILHSGITSSEEKRRRIEAFRKGAVNIALTVDMFNEGIDVPEANIIVFLRSTQSKTIFLQQLGRGLRKADGKESVVVLDFVANCERMEMINEFHESIKFRQQASSQERAGEYQGTDLPVEIALDSFEFNETAKRVLDVIGRVRMSYTKESVVEQLQALAQEIGRRPTKSSIEIAARENKVASVPNIRQLFGTLTSALAEAGFKPIKKDREGLKQQILKLQRHLKGRVPCIKDLNEYRKVLNLSGFDAFIREFGTWNQALQAAGITPVHTKSKPQHFSREELKKQLLKLQEHTEKEAPGVRDLEEHKSSLGLASFESFRKEFGTWNLALQAVGIQPDQVHHNVTNEELKQQLVKLREYLGAVPRVIDLKQHRKELGIASHKAFFRRFGSWKNALREAGLLNEVMVCSLIEEFGEKGVYRSAIAMTAKQNGNLRKILISLQRDGKIGFVRRGRIPELDIFISTKYISKEKQGGGIK